jgi:hypothetical protein
MLPGAASVIRHAISWPYWSNASVTAWRSL